MNAVHCPSCQTPTVWTLVPEARVFDGTRVEAQAPALKCPTCQEPVWTAPLILQAERAICDEALGLFGETLPAELLAFARRVLSLDAAAMADVLGVTVEAWRGWERDGGTLPLGVFARLRAIVGGGDVALSR
ncbi:MAG: hypothetical protein JNK72_24880 [Myxococcales bacterium]|nr:hypothetical protein [Myxococcales bacterium]